MACDQNFVEYVCEQISGAGEATYKKMFGEYMVYCNAKPVFLLCNNTVYVKVLPETQALLQDAQQAEPYGGAKPHYVVEDLENREFMTSLAAALERVTPLPKPRKKK